MPDSTSKKILDSALTALLKGLELSPWIKVPATFVEQLSKRFQNLPADEKAALGDASESEIQETLPSDATDEPARLAEDITKAAFRGRALDYVFGLVPPALDELVTSVDGASRYVTKDAPVARKASELIAFVESSDGPGLRSLPIPPQ